VVDYKKDDVEQQLDKVANASKKIGSFVAKKIGKNYSQS